MADQQSGDWGDQQRCLVPHQGQPLGVGGGKFWEAAHGAGPNIENMDGLAYSRSRTGFGHPSLCF